MTLAFSSSARRVFIDANLDVLRVGAKEKYPQVASPRVSRVQPIESQFRRVNKVSISEDIAQQILDLISSGKLVPGQRLPSERELCKNFGAARSSLREALRGLSMIGVLTARVGEGTSVAADGGKFLGKIMEWRLITEKHDIENLLEVRIALEGIAAANVARDGNEADIAKLSTLAGEDEELRSRIRSNSLRWIWNSTSPSPKHRATRFFSI